MDRDSNYTCRIKNSKVSLNTESKLPSKREDRKDIQNLFDIHTEAGCVETRWLVSIGILVLQTKG